VILGLLVQIRQLLTCFHLAVDEDLARDVGRDHQPVRVDRAVDLLHDVQVYLFVFLVKGSGFMGQSSGFGI